MWNLDGIPNDEGNAISIFIVQDSASIVYNPPSFDSPESRLLHFLLAKSVISEPKISPD